MVREQEVGWEHESVHCHCLSHSSGLHLQLEVAKGESRKVILYLLFVNFKFFQESQTLADIIQRKIAKYGDDSGIFFLIKH